MTRYFAQLKKTSGFTLIELIIVVTIIGILGTLVFVAYTGIQSAARDSSVLSDLDALDGIQTQYGLKNGNGGKDWYSGPSGTNGAADPALGFTPSAGNIIDVITNSTDYCIRGYNAGANFNSIDNAATRESSEGVCDTIGPSISALTDSPSGSGNRGIVALFAGSTYGYADGAGASARFRYPYGVDVDSSGNVYIADSSNHRIRKITPTGAVSTLAGSTFGSTDGTGASAQFEYPLDVAVDSSNNIYVVEENCRVRKVTPAGVVTTFAGSLTYNCAYVDAVGTSARFDEARNIAIDGSDNLYVADRDNRRIRKITPDGTVTTLAGSGATGYVDGVGTAAQFGTYFSVGADNAGNVYVSDSSNKRIRKITPDGTVTTLAGSGATGYVDGVGTAAQFQVPGDITVDADGVIYVTDRNRIRKILPDGTVTTPAGSGVAGTVDGTGITAQFNWPFGITVNDSGVLYVSEEHRIRKIQ